MAWFDQSLRKNGLLRWFRNRLAAWIEAHPIPETAIILSTAVLVGAAVGLASIGFRYLIELFQEAAYGGLGGLLSGIRPAHLLIIPVLGAIVYGPVIHRYAREAKGHGVPEVMAAVAVRDGKIRPQVALVKAFSSSLCIGTGGSAGSEGPVVQIGSAMGSTLGQLLGLSPERVRSLVACGAAGGISATFNSPVAGAIFAMEVILGRMHSGYFGAVVISSVVADVVAHQFLGNLRTFSVPQYSLVSPWELILYALLGLLSALAALAFVKFLYWMEDFWAGVHFPEAFKPALGAALLGVLGILTFKQDGFPLVFGVGYESINAVLVGELTFQLALALLALKLLATVLTLGSGGSGGVFAPGLFMGAMLGGAFGQVVHQLFPAVTAPPGAYALVGMSAVFAGAAHAPITSIIMLFEMSNDYSLILPLMLSTVISVFVSRAIQRDSIYTLKLSRRGINLENGTDIDVMQGVTVGEVMDRQTDAVQPDMALEELEAVFTRTRHHGFPVVDEDGRLFGVVTLQDLASAQERGALEGLTVADIATTQGVLVAYPDEPMWKALNRLGALDVSRLPVVESPESRRLVGQVRRRDIILAYNRAIQKRAREQVRVDTLRLGRLDSASFLQVEVPPGSPVVGRYVKDLRLPQQCLIVSLRRGRRLQVANGYTVLNAGDQLNVFCGEEQRDEVRALIESGGGLPATSEAAQYFHRQMVVQPGSRVLGRRVSELALPRESLLVSIRRGKQTLIPHGGTVFHSGDVVEVFGTSQALDEIDRRLGVEE